MVRYMVIFAYFEADIYNKLVQSVGLYSFTAKMGGVEGFGGGYTLNNRENKEDPEIKIADKIVEDLKHARCRYPDIRRQAIFYKPTLNAEQVSYIVQAAETKVVIEVARGVSFPAYAQVPTTDYFKKQVEGKKKERELQVLAEQKAAEQRQIEEQLKREREIQRQKIQQKLAAQNKAQAEPEQPNKEGKVEAGPDQTRDRPDPEKVYTDAERSAFRDFFAGLVHIDETSEQGSVTYANIDMGTLIKLYGKKGAKRKEGGGEVGYSWFNQDNGQQKNIHLFDTDEFKKKTSSENQEIRDQATNRHLMIYGIALAQYQMLKECGYTKEEITFDPSQGVAYPKDFQKLETYRAHQIEKNKKISEFNKENPQYQKSITKVNSFLDKMAYIVANEQGYQTQGGQKLFRSEHYPSFLKLQGDLDAINKGQGPQLEQAWDQTRASCGLEEMKLYDALQRFEKINQELEQKRDISPLAAAQFLEISACLEEEPFKAAFEQYKTAVSAKINAFGPKLYPQMVNLVGKFYEDRRAVPSQQDWANVQNYTSACNDYLGQGSNSYYWNTFDGRAANYYNNRTLLALQDHGASIASDDGLRTYANKFYALRASRNEPFNQRNADFEQYKTGGVVGKFAYGINGVLTGMLNPITGLVVAPINIYRQIKLGYIPEASERKQQMDAYMNGGFIQFIQAIRPPDCMISMTRPDSSFDRMNLPFKLSVQIMDSVMILAGGALVTGPIKSGLLKLGMQETSGLLRYTTDFFATMTATTAMHLQQHMATGLDGGLKNLDVILYGMFAVVVESGFEGIGGLTPTSFAEMGKILMKGGLKQAAKKLSESIAIENLEEIGTEHVMNITHELINKFGAKNMPISGIDNFKALILLTTLSVGMIQRVGQINQSLNFKAAFGTQQEQEAFAKLLQVIADHEIFRDIYIEIMVTQMEQELRSKGITKTKEQLKEEANNNIAALMELFGIKKAEDKEQEDNETAPNSSEMALQDIYNNLAIIDDTIRCEKALAALQAKGLCKDLDDEQKKHLFALIIHAHRNRNRRPTTNDDGTAVKPLGTVKDEQGHDLQLYPLHPEDTNAEYAYLKAGLLRMGLQAKDATAGAQLLMREGRCAEVRSLRDYQEEAVDAMMNLAKQRLKSATLSQTERNNLNLILKKQFLLEMATGSGKTFTVVSMLNRLYKLREELIANQPELGNKLPPLRVLVLSHQIAIADQHKQDFFEGKSVEDNPLLDEDIIGTSHVRVFHSKAKIDTETGEATETGEETKVQEETGSGPNEFVFATHQTAAKGLDGFVPNIIIADEAHHTDDSNSNYHQVLASYANKKDQNGTLPLVINLTATPTDNVRARVGENRFTYALPEYLASEYSPDVVYRAVGFGDITQAWISSELTRINNMPVRNEAQKKLRKEAIKEFKERLEEMKKKFDDSRVMVDDLKGRLEGDFSQTIIFAESIAEADKIAEYINETLGEGTAEAMHSKSGRSTQDILKDYKSQKVKTLVVVNQLNEAIDLPETKNIVFARGTNSDTIFKQQLGRGLRGNGTVTIWDYVGSMVNLTKINDLNEGMRKSQKEREGAGKAKTKQAKQITIFEGEHTEPTQTTFDQKNTIAYTIHLLNDIVAAVEQGTPEKAMQGFRKKYGETPTAATMLSLMRMTPQQREQEIYIKLMTKNRPGRQNTHEQRFDLLIEIYPSQKSVINALRGQALKTLNEQGALPPAPPPTPPGSPPAPGGATGPQNTPPPANQQGETETKNTIPDPKKSIEDAGYAYTEVEGEIIPAEQMSEQMKQLMREGTGAKEQAEQHHYDKVGAVLRMCRAKGISLKKEHIMIGTVQPRGWRKTSYVAIYIEQYNKTIFLSNEHKNATFVINDKMEVDDMTSIMRSDLRRLASGQLVQRIIFTDPTKREKDVEKALFEGPVAVTLDEDNKPDEGPDDGGSGPTETTIGEGVDAPIVYPTEIQPLIEKINRMQALTIDLFRGNAVVRTKRLTDIITPEQLNQLKAAAGIEGNWVDGMTGNIKPREWIKLMMYIYGNKAFTEFRKPWVARFKLLNNNKPIKELLRLSPTVWFANFGSDKILCMEILGVSMSESNSSTSVERKTAILYGFMPMSDIQAYEQGKNERTKEQEETAGEREQAKQEFINRVRSKYTPYTFLEDTEYIRWASDLSVTIRGHTYTHDFLTNTLGLTISVVTPISVRNRLLFNLVFDEATMVQFTQDFKKDIIERFAPNDFVKKENPDIDDIMKRYETILESMDAFYFQGFTKKPRNERYQRLCDYVFGVSEYQKALVEYANALSVEIKQYFEPADFVGNTYIVRGANDILSYRINGETHTRKISAIEEATGLTLTGLGAAKRNETLCTYVFGPNSYTQAQQEGRQGVNQIVNTLRTYSARDFIKEDVIKRDGDVFSYRQGGRQYQVSVGKRHQFLGENFSEKPIEEKNKLLCDYLYGEHSYEEASNKLHEEIKRLRARDFVSGEKVHREESDTLFCYPQGGGFTRLPIHVVERLLGIADITMMERHARNKIICETALGSGTYEQAREEERQIFTTSLKRRTNPTELFLGTTIEYGRSLRIRTKDVGLIDDINNLLGIQLRADAPKEQNSRILCDAIFGPGSYDKASEK